MGPVSRANNCMWANWCGCRSELPGSGAGARGSFRLIMVDCADRSRNLRYQFDWDAVKERATAQRRTDGLHSSSTVQEFCV